MRFLNRALAVSVLSLAGLGVAIAVPVAASASPSVNLDGGHTNCHTRSSETCGPLQARSNCTDLCGDTYNDGWWNARTDYAALCPTSFGYRFDSSYQQNWNFGGPDCTPCPQLAVAPCPPKLTVIPCPPKVTVAPCPPKLAVTPCPPKPEIKKVVHQKPEVKRVVHHATHAPVSYGNA